MSEAPEIRYSNPQAISRLFALRRDRQIEWRTLAVALTVSCFANGESGQAWPSRKTIADILGIDERSVSRSLREAEKAGFITTEKRAGRSNVYSLTPGYDATLSPLVVTTPGHNATPGCNATPPLVATAKTPLVTMPPITIKEQYKNNHNAKQRPQKPKVTITDDGFVIPDAIRQTWTKAYPRIDLDHESAKAFAWCQNNPSKAPRKEYGRFLNGWLGRARTTIKVPVDDGDTWAISEADAAEQLDIERRLAADPANQWTPESRLEAAKAIIRKEAANA